MTTLEDVRLPSYEEAIADAAVIPSTPLPPITPAAPTPAAPTPAAPTPAAPTPVSSIGQPDAGPQPRRITPGQLQAMQRRAAVSAVTRSCGDAPVLCYGAVGLAALAVIVGGPMVLAWLVGDADVGLYVALAMFPVGFGLLSGLAWLFVSSVLSAGLAVSDSHRTLPASSVWFLAMMAAAVMVPCVMPMGFVGSIYSGLAGELERSDLYYRGDLPLPGSSALAVAADGRNYFEFSPQSYKVWFNATGSRTDSTSNNHKITVYPITATGDSRVVMWSCVCSASVSGCRSFPALHSMGKTEYLYPERRLNSAVRVRSSLWLSKCRSAIDSAVARRTFTSGVLTAALSKKEAIILEWNDLALMKRDVATLLTIILSVFGSIITCIHIGATVRFYCLTR